MAKIIVDRLELNEWAASWGIPSPLSNNGIAFVKVEQLQDLPKSLEEFRILIEPMMIYGSEHGWVKAFPHYEAKKKNDVLVGIAWTSYYLDIPKSISNEEVENHINN